MHANCFGDKYSYILFACTIVTFHKLYVANDTGIAKARSICPGVVCLSWVWNNLVTHDVYLEVFISFAMNEPKLLTYFDLLSFFFKTKCFQTTVKPLYSGQGVLYNVSVRYRRDFARPESGETAVSP